MPSMYLTWKPNENDKLSRAILSRSCVTTSATIGENEDSIETIVYRIFLLKVKKVE